MGAVKGKKILEPLSHEASLTHKQSGCGEDYPMTKITGDALVFWHSVQMSASWELHGVPSQPMR